MQGLSPETVKQIYLEPNAVTNTLLKIGVIFYPNQEGNVCDI